MTQGADLVDALNTTFGKHQGYRASHAKGVAVRGRFIPSAEAVEVRVPLLSTETAVVGRLSVGGGKPGISDKSPTVRGIGISIGDGSEIWTMALVSAPVFFANSAIQFRDFLKARVPDPTLGGPNPETVQAFNAANPNTVPHQAYLKSTPPCRSYSTEAYHSGHAYGLQTTAGKVWARIALEPELGRIGLSDTEMQSHPDTYLQDALRAELKSAPVRWTVKAVIANLTDTLSDPTEPWGGDNRTIALGVIEIDAIDESNAGPTKVYDPSHMPSGVIKPEDNVFDLRSPAYAVSVARRQVT